jgi:hypothetical protein
MLVAWPEEISTVPTFTPACHDRMVFDILVFEKHLVTFYLVSTDPIRVQVVQMVGSISHILLILEGHVVGVWSGIWPSPSWSLQSPSQPRSSVTKDNV